MARKPRSVLPPVGVYHVCARGVEQRAIFLDVADWQLLLALLHHATSRYRWEILAYCLMTNHFHLVIDAELTSISRGMHLLNARYAQAFNHRYARHGHLFQDRFYAGAVEGDEAVQAVCDYVLDNPLRAFICDTRAGWRWLGGSCYAP